MRLFQRDAYISIDFLDKKTEIIRLKDQGGAAGMLDIPLETVNGEKKLISVEMPDIPLSNAIHSELAEFAEAILNDKPVRVSVIDGYQAMDVAYQVLKKMSMHNEMHNA